MCASDGLTELATDAGTRQATRVRQPIEEDLALDTGIIRAQWFRCVDHCDKRNPGVAIGHQEKIIRRIESHLVGAKVSTTRSGTYALGNHIGVARHASNDRADLCARARIK